MYCKDWYDEDTLNNIQACSEENKKEKNDTEENENQTLFFGLIGLSAEVLIGIATLLCLKRKGMMCFKIENQESIVHQNELYGNMSNEDYFAERYYTNIVDTNQYYEEEYGA